MNDKGPKFDKNPGEEYRNFLRMQNTETANTENLAQEISYFEVDEAKAPLSVEGVDLSIISKNLHSLHNIPFETAKVLIDSGYGGAVLESFGSVVTFNKNIQFQVLTYLVETDQDRLLLAHLDATTLSGLEGNKKAAKFITLLLERDEKYWEIFGSSEVLAKTVKLLLNPQLQLNYNYTLIDTIVDKGFGAQVIAIIDQVFCTTPKKKALVEKLIQQEENREAVVSRLWQLIKFSGIPKEEFVESLLKLGYFNWLVLEKSFNSQEVENLVVKRILDTGNKDAQELMIASLKERRGLDRSIALQAAELGYASRVFEYRESFESLHGKALLAIIDALPLQEKVFALKEVLSELEELTLEHAKLLIVEGGFGKEVLEYIRNFLPDDIQEIFHLLVTHGYEKRIIEVAPHIPTEFHDQAVAALALSSSLKATASNITKFSGLKSTGMVTLIDNILSRDKGFLNKNMKILAEALPNFQRFSQAVADRFIEQGLGTVVRKNLPSFSGLEEKLLLEYISEIRKRAYKFAEWQASSREGAVSRIGGNNFAESLAPLTSNLGSFSELSENTLNALKVGETSYFYFGQQDNPFEVIGKNLKKYRHCFTTEARGKI